MSPHPNRGRAAPDCAIDFTVPCVPDIHAMPKPVRAAGAKIRREIQRRFSAWKDAERSAGQYARWAGRSAQGARISEYKNEADAAAELHWRKLSDAYLWWARTSSGAAEYTPDPALLRSVCEADEID